MIVMNMTDLLNGIKNAMSQMEREAKAQAQTKQRVEALMRDHLARQGVEPERFDAIFKNVGRFTSVLAEQYINSGADLSGDEERVIREFVLAVELTAMQIRMGNDARLDFCREEAARRADA